MRPPDCDSAVCPSPAPISMEVALARLLDHARPVAETEAVPLGQALGRVLTAPVTSAIDVPGWDNSAMDGYAVRAADLVPEVRLRVDQRIPAGVVGRPLAPGTAARIFTGAPIPQGADTVAIQEVCSAEGDSVVVHEAPRCGANIRRAGEDIGRGAEVIAAGVRLQPQHLGLAASVGVERLTVRRRLRVALFASGDELVMPGEPLGPGQIYNSNQFTLAGLLEQLNCEVLPLGIVEDTLEATMAALSEGARRADLVLASGGVSVGEEDHVKPAVEQLGTLDLWKIAIRPGKPLAFGHIEGTPLIGSPGNPVSLFVTFCLFARPFILRCQGVADCAVAPLRAVAGFDWVKPAARRELARARLAAGEDGVARVVLFPSRSSGVLSSVAWANGLAVIPEGHTLVAGDPVDFLPFSELLS
jgi:molybdopterin molybdotransferase